MFYDPTFLLLIPAMILALYAQFKVKGTYSQFAKLRTRKGLSGAEIARNLLDEGGLRGVEIESIPGEMTDHYDPRDKKLRLSREVYSSSSVAAAGIVAHEVGHAMQDARAYAPLKLRNNFVPMASFGTTLAFPLFFIGLFLSLPIFMDIGIIAFSLAVAFQVITLPVEFNASSRAMVLLREGHYLTSEELGSAKKVLSAAALTYVAATAMAVLQLLRLLMLRGRRD